MPEQNISASDRPPGHETKVLRGQSWCKTTCYQGMVLSMHGAIKACKPRKHAVPSSRVRSRQCLTWNSRAWYSAWYAGRSRSGTRAKISAYPTSSKPALLGSFLSPSLAAAHGPAPGSPPPCPVDANPAAVSTAAVVPSNRMVPTAVDRSAL